MTALLCYGLALPAAAAESAAGYRLAGTVAVGRDFIAFLEVPGGGQMLVRAGDTIDSAKVVAIRDRAIDLVLPSGRMALSLVGAERQLNPIPSRDVLTGQSSQDHILQREVDTQAFAESLAAAPATRGEPGAALARKFAPVLNLPAQGTVLSVNSKAVESVDGAMRTIEQTLAEGGVVYMTLDTPTGIQRVYLTPQRRDDTTTPSNP